MIQFRSICACGRSKWGRREKCCACRAADRDKADRAIAIKLRCKCGKRIRSGNAMGLCYECRVRRFGYTEADMAGDAAVPTPDHILDRMELYAARIEAGEPVFRGYERDRRQEYGWAC